MLNIHGVPICLGVFRDRANRMLFAGYSRLAYLSRGRTGANRMLFAEYSRLGAI